MNRARLADLLTEYENSLARAEGERELQTAIAAKAEIELPCDKKHFVALAKARAKDKLWMTRDDLQKTVDLFDWALDDPPVDDPPLAGVEVEFVSESVS